MRSVLVGVDGSTHSAAALGVAALEARCRSGDLHVVHVYEPAHTPYMEAAAAVMAGGTWTTRETGDALLGDAQRRDAEVSGEAQRHAEGWLRQFVKGVDVDLSGLEVQLTAVGDEHAASALVRLSRSSDLLVVGSRGRGGFAGVLLGSISQHCVRHAACAVLVAREEGAADS